MSGNGPPTGTAPKHEADAPKACCIPENPRGGPRGRQLRPLPAADQNSAQGAERRLASLRAQLLPPLSAGRAPSRAGRHVDQPRRVSVRHQRKEQAHEFTINRQTRIRSNHERPAAESSQHASHRNLGARGGRSGRRSAASLAQAQQKKSTQQQTGAQQAGSREQPSRTSSSSWPTISATPTSAIAAARSRRRTSTSSRRKACGWNRSTACRSARRRGRR